MHEFYEYAHRIMRIQYVDACAPTGSLHFDFGHRVFVTPPSPPFPRTKAMVDVLFFLSRFPLSPLAVPKKLPLIPLFIEKISCHTLYMCYVHKTRGTDVYY